MSKITRLEVSNFKRIRAVEIRPAGSVVQIRGKNGMGKSSCLDAIAAALGGEKLCPAQPIRRGETEAIIRASIDNYEDYGPVTAERRFKANEDGTVSSTLKLYRDDGLRLDKPQRRLDELVQALAWDPLAFLRMAPKEQAETLRKLSGVDFSLLDAKRHTAYEDRTAANRQVAQFKARLQAMPVVDAPDQVVSAADLLAEQERRRQIAEANEAKRRELTSAREEFKAYEEEISEHKTETVQLERALADKYKRLAECEKYLGELRGRGAALRAEVEALQEPNLDEVPTKIREVEATNERVRAKKARAQVSLDLAKAEEEATKLDEQIATIDTQKAMALAGAQLPVPGLSFTEDGVLLDGLPLEQAAQSQQLRVSIAMGGALNPRLRAMLVRDGSLLDEESLALLREEATKADLQIWLEMVGKGGEGVVIEDGQVESADHPQSMETVAS